MSPRRPPKSPACSPAKIFIVRKLVKWLAVSHLAKAQKLRQKLEETV